MNFVDGTGVLENQHMLVENKNQQESTAVAVMDKQNRKAHT